MAQQYPQYPPRPFSPLQRTDSPHTGPYPPAPKRQRLSPNPQSPYASPSMSNISLPNQVFSAPYYGGQANGGQSHNNYNMVNPYNANNAYTPINTPHPPTPTGPPAAGATGAMGPPSRPIDKPTDINELDDVLMGSGVNLRDEDEALTNQVQRQSQEAPKPYPFPRNNYYAQHHPGDRNSFYGGGTFNQPTAPYQSAEEIAESDHKRLTRRRYEIQQYELASPFLMAASLKRRMDTEVNRMQVKFDDSGLFVPQQDLPPHKLAVQGPDGNDVIRVVQNEDILRCHSTLAEILSLISLAAEERLRAIVEDAATLAKGRKIGSHGIVPHDIADLAVGNGVSETAAALPTPDNSAISPTSNPLKRMKQYPRAAYSYLHLDRVICRSQQASHTRVTRPNPKTFACRPESRCASPAQNCESGASPGRRKTCEATTSGIGSWSRKPIKFDSSWRLGTWHTGVSWRASSERGA